jgi:IS4 transposase
LTNDFTSDANTITELYRKRWAIELFFKWIKQHLKIKSFWGTTENAVKIQVYCAIITYCLVAIVAKQVKTEYTIYEILQIVGKSLLDKTPINQLLTKNEYNYFNELNCNSLFGN